MRLIITFIKYFHESAKRPLARMIPHPPPIISDSTYAE